MLQSNRTREIHVFVGVEGAQTKVIPLLKNLRHNGGQNKLALYVLSLVWILLSDKDTTISQLVQFIQIPIYHHSSNQFHLLGKKTIMPIKYHIVSFFFY